MYYLPTNAIWKLHLSELHLYGAKRLGMRSSNLLVASTNGGNSTQEENNGEKRYELTNHLGNVLAVVSGEKATDGSAQILSLTDYYPFGMEIDGRKYVKDGGYRYGFTGHEKEFDLANDIYATDYRLLDTRIGRWLSVDPLFEKYAGMSPYNYCVGNPIAFWDPDGRRIYLEGNEKTETLRLLQDAAGKSITLYLAEDGEVKFSQNYKGKKHKAIEHSKNAEEIISILQKDFNLRITTVDGYTYTSKSNSKLYEVDGGAFDGNDINNKDAYQVVNPKMFFETSDPSNLIMHEITEAREGYDQAVENGVSTKNANLEPAK